MVLFQIFNVTACKDILPATQEQAQPRESIEILRWESACTGLRR